MAIVLVLGANSLSNSKRLPVSSRDAELIPARLLPEPEKLLKSFCEFPALRKTTGMGVPCVARAAATVAVVEEVTIRSTCPGPIYARWFGAALRFLLSCNIDSERFAVHDTPAPSYVL